MEFSDRRNMRRGTFERSRRKELLGTFSVVIDRNRPWRLYWHAGRRVPALSWLGYGQTFGLDTPIVVNLGLLVITFGLTIKITIASIIGVVIAIIIYRFL